MGPHRPALSQAQQAQSRQWGHKGKIKLYINIENLKDTSIPKDKLANPKRRTIRTPIRSNHITKYIQRQTKVHATSRQAPQHAPATENHAINHRQHKHSSHNANTSATIYPYPQMRVNPGQHPKTLNHKGIPPEPAPTMPANHPTTQSNSSTSTTALQREEEQTPTPPQNHPKAPIPPEPPPHRATHFPPTHPNPPIPPEPPPQGDFILPETSLETEARIAEETRQAALDPEKPPNTMRLEFGNLFYLSPYKTNIDSIFLIEHLKIYQTDVAMFNEANLQWDKVNTYDNWYERSHEALGRQNYKWAHNRHDHHNPHTKQIGGTGIVARLAAHPRVVDKGEDTHRLGRWTWMKIEGRHQHCTKVLTAYRPHKNTSSLGTVYNQQLRYWREDQNNFTCPIQLFDTQLEELLQ